MRQAITFRHVLPLIVIMAVLGIWLIAPERVDDENHTLDAALCGNGHDSSRLTSQVNQLIAAPTNTTLLVYATDKELESYTNHQILPLIGLSALDIGIDVTGEQLVANVCAAGRRAFIGMSINLENAQGAHCYPIIEIEKLKVGSLSMPGPILELLSRCVTETLQSGELGVRLLSLTAEGDSLYAAFSRQ